MVASGSYLHWKRNQPATDEITKARSAQVITDTYAVFATQAEDIRQKTVIKVAYEPAASPSAVWLSFNVDEQGQPVRLLVDHPLFHNLNWPTVSDGYYSLFQKQPLYQSVTAFIKNPPQQQVILMDPVIVDRRLVSEQANTLMILKNETKVEDLESVNYILTTYRLPIIQDGFSVYEIIVDASHAIIQEGKIGWELSLPMVSELNPMKIQSINVDFRQPAKTRN